MTHVRLASIIDDLARDIARLRAVAVTLAALDHDHHEAPAAGLIAAAVAEVGHDVERLQRTHARLVERCAGLRGAG